MPIFSVVLITLEGFQVFVYMDRKLTIIVDHKSSTGRESLVRNCNLCNESIVISL